MKNNNLEKLDVAIERTQNENKFRKENMLEQKRMIRAFKVLHRWLEKPENEKYAKYWVIGGQRSLSSMVLETVEQAQAQLGLGVKYDIEENKLIENLTFIKEQKEEVVDVVVPILDILGLTTDLTLEEKELVKKQASKKISQEDKDLLKEYEEDLLKSEV